VAQNTTSPQERGGRANQAANAGMSDSAEAKTSGQSFGWMKMIGDLKESEIARDRTKWGWLVSFNRTWP